MAAKVMTREHTKNLVFNRRKVMGGFTPIYAPLEI